MATFSFTKAIYEGAPITVYNNGNMKRDFTFIDDISAGILACIEHVPHYNQQQQNHQQVQ